MNHAIYSEMQDNHGILFILPVQTDTAWCETLYNALLSLDAHSKTQNCTIDTAPSASFYCREIPEAVYPLQDAFYTEKESVLWRDAVNRIAGQFILRYPPGIPLLVPGERITQEILDLWTAAGGSREETVTVLKGETR